MAFAMALAMAMFCTIVGTQKADASVSAPTTVVDASGVRTVAVTPDGSALWVIQMSTHELLGFSTASGHASLGTIALPGQPEDVEIMSDGVHALVPISDLNTVAVVNLSTRTVSTPFEATWLSRPTAQLCG